MKRRNREHPSLFGLLKPGSQKGPFFFRAHETMPTSTPGRAGGPILIAKTFSVPEKSPGADSQREEAFSASMWPSAIRSTERARCISSTVFALFRSSLA